ncbi:MAG: aminoacyl-tRNA deacylase [Anaerolineae bacterium]|jgi:Cys-tRNA(Pro)/Cys-tRNA(Cys) deacylase|nr:aminoacyl-tRNA deacylase [Chloroflexota bacterium]
MPKKSAITNAMRMLDSRGIGYEALTFSTDIHSATGVAAELGLPPERVFKTLVALPDTAARGRPLLAVVPGDSELDLKALAQAAGEKKVRMATQREAESLTGLLVGGISVLALLQKRWPAFLDQSAREGAWLIVSAGQRGINLRMTVDDYLAVTQARLVPLARVPASDER